MEVSQLFTAISRRKNRVWFYTLLIMVILRNVELTKVQVSTNWSSSQAGFLNVSRGDTITLQRLYSGGRWIATNHKGVQGLISEHILDLEHILKESQDLHKKENKTQYISKKHILQEDKMKKVNNQVKIKKNIQNDNSKDQKSYVSNITKKENRQIKAEVSYDWQSNNKAYLGIRQNDIITVRNLVGAWWIGTDKSGKSGLVPASYIKLFKAVSEARDINNEKHSTKDNEQDPKEDEEDDSIEGDEDDSIESDEDDSIGSDEDDSIESDEDDSTEDDEDDSIESGEDDSIEEDENDCSRNINYEPCYCKNDLLYSQIPLAERKMYEEEWRGILESRDENNLVSISGNDSCNGFPTGFGYWLAVVEERQVKPRSGKFEGNKMTTMISRCNVCRR